MVLFYKSSLENYTDIDTTKVSAESLEAFRNCMNTEAVYKYSIPIGVTSTLMFYGICHLQKSPLPIKLLVIPFGLTAFNAARIASVRECIDKNVPEYSILMMEKQAELQRQRGATFLENWSDQATSNEFNTTDDNNDGNRSFDVSDDTDNNTVGPNKLKPYVTYEELRRKNRASFYQNVQGRKLPVHEKAPPSDPELMNEESTNETKRRIWE